MQTSRTQRAALAELARLLHLPKRKIGRLFVKKRNPLPIPAGLTFDKLIFDGRYLRQLKIWISNERQIKWYRQSIHLDFDLVEKELKKAEKKSTCFGGMNDYPPDYFWG